MSAVQLVEKRVSKPWGRYDLPEPWGRPSDNGPVGEIWFEDPRGGEPDLLVKYLFTSERLSIQVHPGDEAARASGYRCGKDEAWLVLDAQPGAVIGIGLTQDVSQEELRKSALDGSIEALVNWQSVSAGDLIYSPAGTVHAIGAGLTLVEVQQNVDLTYRLFDYGRPRELHLEEGIAAAHGDVYQSDELQLRTTRNGCEQLTGPKFTVELLSGDQDLLLGCKNWLIPLFGVATIEGELLKPGSVWLSEGDVSLNLDGATVLLAR